MAKLLHLYPGRVVGGGGRARLARIVHWEAFPGILLIASSAVALVWANSPWAGVYRDALAAPITVDLGAYAITKPVLLWINDGLMALFFLLVGLETY